MNVLLNNMMRKKYASTIEELAQLCPDTIARKFPEANVQQAFTFDMTLKNYKKGKKVLCVGSYEDTACEALVAKGVELTPIDPEINYSLEKFDQINKEKFDIIFSTSVLEHVKDDENFIGIMCRLLKPNGIAVLTCDFNDSYVQGGNKPGEDYRLYTKKDLLERLNLVLEANGCSIEGKVDYQGEPDFHYGGCVYSFATYCFRKNAN